MRSRPIVGMLVLCVSFGDPRSAQGQTARGIVVEAVNDYGGNGDLGGNITNVKGFRDGMRTTSGISWTKTASWFDGDVFDTDFVDREVNPVGRDDQNFDRNGTAVSFFSGHGSCDDQEYDPRTCRTRANCPTRGGFAGVCTRVPGAQLGKCEYALPRYLVVHSDYDQFGGWVNYSDGPVRLGESVDSRPWAFAGTNGGVNLAILDVSCGATPGFLFRDVGTAFAGAHLVATVMPAHVGSDTADSSDRGSLLAAAFRANPHGSVGSAWQNLMNSAVGGECTFADGVTTSPGHGINGCGLYVVASREEDEFWTKWAVKSESWADLQYDVNDGRAGLYDYWKGLCNWDCQIYPYILP